MVASSGRSKNLPGWAGKTGPESAATDGLWGEVEADPSALAVQRRQVSGGVQLGASAGRRARCRCAGAAGLEAGCRKLVLLAAHLEPEGAQTVLDDHAGAVIQCAHKV